MLILFLANLISRPDKLRKLKVIRLLYLYPNTLEIYKSPECSLNVPRRLNFLIYKEELLINRKLFFPSVPVIDPHELMRPLWYI